MDFKILFFSVLISVVGAQLEEEPQTTAVRVGSSVTFLCTLTADQVAQGWTITWKEGEEFIYVGSTGVNSNPTKYTISGNANLQIKEVTTEDAGLYQCRVYPKGGTAPFDRTAKLIVIGKMDCPNNNGLMVEQGKGEVTCMAQISPDDQDFELKWYNKGGTELPCNKSMNGLMKSCKAHFVTMWNDVSMFCRLEIDVGGVEVKEECETSPPFVINYAIKQLKIMPFDMSGGQKTEFYSGEILNCSAMGYPEPTYIWEELNIETEESMGQVSTEASLPLNGMSGDKKFRCTVSNSFGEEFKDTPRITVLKGTGTGEVGDNAGMHVTVSLAVILMTSLISLSFATTH
ncbi:unnamed protein product [Owenia fusiformis]|uniref:Ig-like domain-containing protein n=1 Tax=Owenia fusiformis TaxID=6347 RepID=A0A8S4Q160_OWEFU|nr:unnamed protein product [Owenia fusiformis]